MRWLSRLTKKLKSSYGQNDAQGTFCCVYGERERPRCWQFNARLAQAEIDCAYHAVREGYPTSSSRIGSCRGERKKEEG